jgi:hypothetical protein
MNRGEIRAYCKGQYALEESPDDPFYTDSLWNRYINREYQRLTARARLFGNTWTGITTVAGTREYSLVSLSPSIASVQMVLYKQGGTSGTWRPLNAISADQLTRAVDAWHDETGSPTHYYFRGLSIGLRPTPDATNAGAFLEIWGWSMPAELDDDTDEPQEALVELLQYVEGLDPSARFVDATHDLVGADYGW